VILDNKSEHNLRGVNERNDLGQFLRVEVLHVPRNI